MNNELIVNLIFIIIFIYLLYWSQKNTESFNSEIILSKLDNMDEMEIEIEGVIRKYLAINIKKSNDISDLLLCFHGGGESIKKFKDYTNLDKIGSQVIIFKGQPSGNKYSWQNAYPWLLKNNYQNDVLFVDTVINTLFGNKKLNIFLTGKSDGAGFTILFSALSKYKNYIKAIAIFSGAHFGITSSTNIGSYNSNNIFLAKKKIIIPKNIIIPSSNISLLIMHGTSDSVMPYQGQHYKNRVACKKIKKTIWKLIDNQVKCSTDTKLIQSNTYTVNINDYYKKIILNGNFINIKCHQNTSNYKFNSFINCKNTVLNLFELNNQNHCWSGHINSGPDSNKSSNFNFDATYLLVLFFDLDIGNYKPTIPIIPKNFYNYKKELIIV